MEILLRWWSVVVVAANRLRSQGRLTLAVAAGLTILVALVMSIPAYADAVSYRILSTNLLGDSVARVMPDVPRSPFIFKFQYSGTFRGAAQLEQIKPLDDYLSRRASVDLGLPQKWLVRYFKSYPFQIFTPADVATAEQQERFSWASFSTLSDVQQHVTIVAGNFPAVAPATSDSPIEVLVSESLATTLGASVGDTYVAYNRDSEAITKIPIQISGIWRANDPSELYWFTQPKDFYNDLMVPEATYAQRIAPNMKDELDQVVWYLALDSTSFHSGDVTAFVDRIKRVEMNTGILFTGAFMKQSPKDMLLEYQRTTNLLTFSLTAFSVPIAALFLAFINLVESVTVRRQRNEIALMRSRGATMSQMLGISVLEGVLLVAVSVAAGIPLSKGIILLMGKTRSFLDFSLPGSLRLDITTISLAFSVCAALVVLAVRLLQVIGAARHTIVTYKQEQARSLRPPWWQRAWMDVLLFIPAAYGTYLLRKQGSLVLPGIIPSDPFQNPLLLMVPALGIFAVTLFLLRLLPGIMSAITWLVSRTSSVSLLQATRYLSRTPGFYSVPLMLLVLTLSLSTFTATLAQTLDIHYNDQQYYYGGADIRLVENGQCLKSDSMGNCDVNAPTSESPTWSFLPVSAHLKVPGVQAAARVGSWSANAVTGGNVQKSTFIGIDRLDFPQVAFWRRDFAPSSLGTLMNDLALADDGVLVSRQYMQQYALNMGDTVTLDVDVYRQTFPITLKIVGSFDLFPTWYPASGLLFVGNLDYFFMRIEGQQPYNVWLKTDPAVSCTPLMDVLRTRSDLRLDVVSCISARQNIVTEQKRPEHQGLFGLLSVGFTGAALLTVLGFLLYALFSFQQRFIELSVLRAVGLSIRQMIFLLAWELVFLIGVGLAAGTGLGLLVSWLFIPYLQMGANSMAQVPPFVVTIAWERIYQIYILFGLLFVAALIGLISLLARMKIFQAIKLGETM